MGMVLFALIVGLMMLAIFGKLDSLEKSQKNLGRELQAIKNVRLRFIVSDIKNIDEILTKCLRHMGEINDRLHYVE